MDQCASADAKIGLSLALSLSLVAYLLAMIELVSAKGTEINAPVQAHYGW